MNSFIIVGTEKYFSSSMVKQFPNENLTVSAKKLFCEDCKEVVSLKCSSIRNHVKCEKHGQLRRL